MATVLQITATSSMGTRSRSLSSSSSSFNGLTTRSTVNLSSSRLVGHSNRSSFRGLVVKDAAAMSAPKETSGSVDEEVSVEDGIVDSEEVSVIMSSLQSYKEALIVGDESKVAEIEAFLQSIEDEKEALAIKVTTLSEELSSAKDRTLRISADFDNFQKRTERERLSLVTNAQGEVVETMLPVLDNFERAKSQIKFETEGEEKINNSYQSIYKQFGEILGSLGVVPVETVGTPFDPLLHEAIMREDSEEFEEGIILQEFRKGFKLGERLLRPSMVKVSAGPGPAKPVAESTPSEDAEDVNGTTIAIEEEEISSSEGESA